MPLWDAYSELKTSYYGIEINVDNLFGTENAESQCETFICKHFEKGCKEEALRVLADITRGKLNNGKAIHMVSLYLLGCYLYPIFEGKILQQIKAEKGEQDKEFFMYIWYLTCLYHDTFSEIENTSDDCIKGKIEFYTCKINEDANKENEDTSEDTIYSHSCKNGKLFLPRFQAKTIYNYYKYRKKKSKEDHGIVAGYVLYDALNIDFKRATEGFNFDEKGEYVKGCLRWKKIFLDYFAYVSDAIICHNVWMAYTDEKIKEYKENGLNELIIAKDGSNKLSIDNYPLQFMLCLLDTIEPIKRFCDGSHKADCKTCLKNISIEYKGGNKIKINWTDVVKGSQNFYTWLGNIHEMTEWMEVKVSSCKKDKDGCYVIISF